MTASLTVWEGQMLAAPWLWNHFIVGLWMDFRLHLQLLLNDKLGGCFRAVSALKMPLLSPQMHVNKDYRGGGAWSPRSWEGVCMQRGWSSRGWVGPCEDNSHGF